MIERSRDADSLALAAGHPDSPFAEHRIELLRQLGHETVQARALQHGPHPSVVDLVVFEAERDVSPDAVVEDVDGLRHIADTLLPLRCNFMQRCVVDSYLSRRRLDD